MSMVYQSNAFYLTLLIRIIKYIIFVFVICVFHEVVGLHIIQTLAATGGS